MAGNTTTVVEIPERDFLLSMQLAEAMGDMSLLCGNVRRLPATFQVIEPGSAIGVRSAESGP